MKHGPNRIPPEHSRPYGCEELHAVCLIPHDDDHGPSVCVAVMLPEADAYFAKALAQTKAFRGRLLIVCDTARQAMQAKKRAMRKLDGWTEVPYAELMSYFAEKSMAEMPGQTLH